MTDTEYQKLKEEVKQDTQAVKRDLEEINCAIINLLISMHLSEQEPHKRLVILKRLEEIGECQGISIYKLLFDRIHGIPKIRELDAQELDVLSYRPAPYVKMQGEQTKFVKEYLKNRW